MKDAGSPGIISIIKKIIKDAKNKLNIKIFNLEKKYEDILIIYLVFDKQKLEPTKNN
tara:strand:- start:429 stop:599 length:171 start_codon:yes stop_codon:yes gene_type:complete